MANIDSVKKTVDAMQGSIPSEATFEDVLIAGTMIVADAFRECVGGTAALESMKKLFESYVRTGGYVPEDHDPKGDEK